MVLSLAQGGVSIYRLMKLTLDRTLAISSDHPTIKQLKMWFPKKAAIVSATVWRGVDTPKTHKDATTVMPTMISLICFVVCPTAKAISAQRANTKVALNIGSTLNKDWVYSGFDKNACACCGNFLFVVAMVKLSILKHERVHSPMIDASYHHGLSVCMCARPYFVECACTQTTSCVYQKIRFGVRESFSIMNYI